MSVMQRIADFCVALQHETGAFPKEITLPPAAWDKLLAEFEQKVGGKASAVPVPNKCPAIILDADGHDLVVVRSEPLAIAKGEASS